MDFWTLAKSRNFSQNTGKVREYFRPFIFLSFSTNHVIICNEFNPFNHERFVRSVDFFSSNILLLLIACGTTSYSIQSCLILVFGHCLFPLPVEGADWVCYSATQASFQRYLVMKFWKNNTKKANFHWASKKPVFDTWLFAQAPTMRIIELWCMGMCSQETHQNSRSSCLKVLASASFGARL